MIKASVTQAKNGLSALLSEVSRGETVLITSRGKPIATLAPYDLAAMPDSEAIAGLVARGVARPPLRQLDLKSFYSGPRPRLPDGITLADLIDEKRAERF